MAPKKLLLACVGALLASALGGAAAAAGRVEELDPFTFWPAVHRKDKATFVAFYVVDCRCVRGRIACRGATEGPNLRHLRSQALKRDAHPRAAPAGAASAWRPCGRTSPRAWRASRCGTSPSRGAEPAGGRAAGCAAGSPAARKRRCSARPPCSSACRPGLLCRLDCEAAEAICERWNAQTPCSSACHPGLLRRLDCEAAEAICERWNVERTPALKLFLGGKELVNYQAQIHHVDLLFPFLMKQRESMFGGAGGSGAQGA